MFTVKKKILILAAVLLVLPATGMAQGKGGGKPTGTTVVPTGGSATVDSLVNRYGPLAGSAENAQSLVSGLRDGTLVVLSRTVTVASQPQTCTRTVQQQQPCQVPVYFPGTTFQIGTQPGTCTVNVNESYDCTPPASSQLQTTTFTPPTGNMGLGNVDIALAFAQAQLTEAGIMTPTPNEVQAALMGGSVTGENNSMNLPGILTLRARSMGWGQIANQLGYKLQ